MRDIVIATQNVHKVREIQQILGDRYHVKLATTVAPGVNWDEIGDTFAANAIIKVEALRPYTQDIIIGEDSGLVVPALDGAPGIYSARWASDGLGEGAAHSNNEKMMKEMTGVTDRRAYYVCCMVVGEAGKEYQIFEGRCHGTILTEPHGDGGFGYDPLFLPSGETFSFGELSAERKNEISHRAIALRKVCAYLARGRSLP